MPYGTWQNKAFQFAFGAADVSYTWLDWAYRRVITPSEQVQLIEKLGAATEYEEWWQAASALDRLPAIYDWRVNPIDKLYDYKHLHDRYQELNRLRRNDNVLALASYLRPGLLRNLFNITTLPLYDKTYIETKAAIQAYIEESVLAIRHIASSATAATSGTGRLTAQEKLDIIYDSKATFGGTALFLQGGSVFGLCHLGIVKALHEHGVMPRVIVGTATGALMAALVGIHTAEELPRFLNGDSIDLSAFAVSSEKARERTAEALKYLEKAPPANQQHNWYSTLERRLRRLIQEGFVLDPHVLADCVQANVGDLTFDEAYKRTDRVLNILVSSKSEEIPSLMNYLTAPNVLIRSAALASFITDVSNDSPIQLLYKDRHGEIHVMDVPPPSSGYTRAARPSAAAEPSKTPTARLKQQFNIDHFIISEARPYIAPFVTPSLPHIRSSSRNGIGQIIPSQSVWYYPAAMVRQTMVFADTIGLLPGRLNRILSDEMVHTDSITIVPELRFADWQRLLKNPTKEEVDFWIMRGERAVWPSLCAIKVRCLIEVALDRAYEQVRRRKTYDPPAMVLQLPSPSVGRQTGPSFAPLYDAATPGIDDSLRRKTPQSAGEEMNGEEFSLRPATGVL